MAKQKQLGTVRKDKAKQSRINAIELQPSEYGFSYAICSYSYNEIEQLHMQVLTLSMVVLNGRKTMASRFLHF